MTRFLLLGLGLWVLSGCSSATSRMIAYFKPSVHDLKHFDRDTLPANPQKTAYYTHKIADSLQTLPPLNAWLDSFTRSEIPKGANLEQFLEASQTYSFIVLRRDTVIYEKYFNGYTPDQPKIVFSVNKAITAMLTEIAVSEGKLEYTQPLKELIPEFVEDGRGNIQIKHLLNMSDGINWVDYKTLYWLGLLYYTPNMRSFIANHTRLKHRPGTHFAYKSITTQVLGLALEAAVQQRLSKYLYERLWKDLGMEYEAYFTVDSKKNMLNRAFGGIAMSPVDMLKIGKMLLQKGQWQGKQLVPQTLTDRLVKRTLQKDKWWGYQDCFWRNGYINGHFLDGSDYVAAGHMGQCIYVSPSNDIVIIRTGESEKFLNWEPTLGRLSAVLNGRETELSHPEKYDFSEQFEGVYETERGERIIAVYKGYNFKGARTWDVYKDVSRTTKNRKICTMRQVDGFSISNRRSNGQRRLMVTPDTNTHKIIGAYYDDLLTIDSHYFEKTSTELPKKYKRRSKFQ